MIKIVLLAAQIIALSVIGILLWQILRKLKSIPEDEIIGQERTNYMTRRLTWIAICSGIIAALQILSAIFRYFEII